MTAVIWAVSINERIVSGLACCFHAACETLALCKGLTMNPRQHQALRNIVTK